MAGYLTYLFAKSYDKLQKYTGGYKRMGNKNELSPDNATYLQPALAALGLNASEFLPADVVTAYNQLEPPPNIDWVGTPVWDTSYRSALRALAAARAAQGWEREQLRPLQADGTANPRYIGDAAVRAATAPLRPTLDQAALKVVMANRVLQTPPEALPSAPWTSGNDSRLGLQAYVGDSLQWFSVSPPRMSEPTKLGRLPEMPDAFLVVLPTAGGKMKVTGDWLARNGVGPGEDSPKVLWVTDQQKLIDDALNPTKTLRKCLPPDTKVTAVWQDHKTAEDVSGQLVLVTKDSVVPEIESGLIVPSEYNIVVSDEADIMMTDLKLPTFRHFDHCKKVLTTATPVRNTQKDLQRMVHHIRPLTPREAAETGVTAPVRIVTFMARDAAHAEQIATTVALRLFIREGKKGVIYCQPGGKSAQATRVAKAIHFHAKEELGKLYNPEAQGYASMVGSARSDSAEVIRCFEDEVEAGMLTTCAMLERGWDPKRLDGSIFIGPQGSWVEFLQKIGRSGRLEPSNPDKIALIVQVKYHTKAGVVDYAAEMVFGYDTVTAGMVIGPEIARASGSGSGSGGLGESPDPDFLRQLSELPESLRAALAPLGRPLVELLIAPDDPRYANYVRPPGFDTSLLDLLEQCPNTDRGWWRETLNNFRYIDPKTGLATIGVPYRPLRRLIDGVPVPDRYYDTAGFEMYISEKGWPKAAPPKSFSTNGLAVYLDVPPSLVEMAVRELKLEIPDKMLPGRNGGKKRAVYWNDEQIARITDWIMAIPEADDTKTLYREIVQRYGGFAEGYVAKHSIAVQTCRHPADSDLNGIGSYIDVGDAVAIHAEHTRITGLMKTHRSITEIARRAGVHELTVTKYLHDDERSYLKDPNLKFSPIGKGRVRARRHLPNAVADAVEARLNRRYLEPYEVTSGGIGEWLGVTHGRIVQLAGSAYLLPVRQLQRGSSGRFSICHIAVLARLNEHYRTAKRRPNHEAILARLNSVEYERLPRIGEELTAEQAAYARYVQREIVGIDAILLEEPVAEAAADSQHSAISEPAGAGAEPGAATVEPEAGVATHGQELPSVLLQSDAEGVAASVTEIASALPSVSVATRGASAEGQRDKDWPAVSADTWHDLAHVLQELECTLAAFAQLVMRDKQAADGYRQLERGKPEVREDMLRRLKDAKRRAPLKPEGWMWHHDLARALGKTEVQLLPYLRQKGVYTSAEEVQIARSGATGQHNSMDVAYAPNFWRRATKWHSSRRQL